MKRIILFIVCIITLLVNYERTWAIPVTLDQATLDTFTQIGSSPDGTTIITFPQPSTATGDPWTKFTTLFDFTPPPAAGSFQSVDVGITGQNLNWSGYGYTSLDLLIVNANENYWNFQLFVRDGSGGVNSSGAVSLGPDAPPVSLLDFTLFSASLAGLNLSDIDDIFIKISANVPPGAGDYTAEYAVAPDPVPVPEPHSLILIGSGLLCLGVVGRKLIKNRGMENLK